MLARRILEAGGVERRSGWTARIVQELIAAQELCALFVVLTQMLRFLALDFLAAGLDGEERVDLLQVIKYLFHQLLHLLVIALKFVLLILHSLQCFGQIFYNR